ncbi:hypothetical protein [Methylobacterium sp. Leaf118]|uniref:hypothetical protein n=1 Tax=Methylobacterium sp. Leaf118 TaxID=2876562 RepID=UPI001E35FC1A|nr:hypothetical protein [Methylobacterium sp. Leaf118]
MALSVDQRDNLACPDSDSWPKRTTGFFLRAALISAVAGSYPRSGVRLFGIHFPFPSSLCDEEQEHYKSVAYLRFPS